MYFSFLFCITLVIISTISTDTNNSVDKAYSDGLRPLFTCEYTSVDIVLMNYQCFLNMIQYFVSIIYKFKSGDYSKAVGKETYSM